MDKVSDQVHEVIKESIKLEINGKKFFDHAATITQSEMGRKVFRRLAQDEERHLKTFGEIFSTFIGNDDWKRSVKEIELKESAQIIEELKARIEKEGREQRSGELEAIRIGMELERKAIDYFERSGRQSEDVKAREIFYRIRDEEKIHYDLLQAQYDSVTNSGFWFDLAEFRMDGKY